jgi:hypothetical protein
MRYRPTGPRVTGPSPGRPPPSSWSWFEEPVSSDDLAGLRQVREHCTADVAAGEYGYGLAYFVPETASTRVVNVDVEPLHQGSAGSELAGRMGTSSGSVCSARALLGQVRDRRT